VAFLCRENRRHVTDGRKDRRTDGYTRCIQQRIRGFLRECAI